MRRLILLLFGASAMLAQPADVGQKLREAQQAFGAGDCGRALPALREVIAADPQNFAAHLLSGHCLLRQQHYPRAASEFQRAVDIRPEASPALLGLTQAHALAGNRSRRDAAIARLRALIESGKAPTTLSFVREQLRAGDRKVLVSESPYLSLLRTRYAFDVLDAREKPLQRLELVSRESEQPAQGARLFSLVSPEAAIRAYPRGEPSYEQVVTDVRAFLLGRAQSNGDYMLAKTPAVVVPFPITTEDPSDARLQLSRGQVAIEYVAHSCFRIHTSSGVRILIDPYASRMWLGYDFPAKVAADAVLITHPHYDHDADVLIGQQPPPWTPAVRVLRDPGTNELSGVSLAGIRGKHAGPWGKEFGQTNTIWLLEVDGLRIVHLGDNGPLTEENVRELGRVDVLMMPIDARQHILKDSEIEAIRTALHPRVLIPMHYRLPDLEASANDPEGLGEIGSWHSGQENVVQLQNNIAVFTAASLLPAQTIVVFPHSAKVSRR